MIYFRNFLRDNSASKGSAMVEAAIFFPIAVFCAMAVITLMLNIYSQTTTQAHVHVRLRAEAAADGGRTQSLIVDEYERDLYRREAESVSFTIVETKNLLTKSLETSFAKTYFGGRFTNPLGYEMEYYARSYIIDESGIALQIKNILTSIID